MQLETITEEEFKAQFEESTDPMGIAGFDGYFIEVNSVFLDTFGYTEEEITKKPWLEFIHPGDVNDTLAEIEKFPTQEKMVNFQNRFVKKSGETVLLSWNAVAKDNKMFAVAKVLEE